MDSISFDSIAPIYDSTRTFNEVLFNDALDYIVQRFPPSQYPKLFEPGIGTGRIAVPLAEKGYNVTGADISGEMLKVLADKIKSKNPPLPITFLRQDITALPFPDASFDIAVAVHIFHLIRAWKKAMNEVFRILKPGAPLVLMFTGVGLEIPGIKDRYRALCAEHGYSVKHIGMQSDTDLPDYLSAAGRRIEWVRNRWEWKQLIQVEKALTDIGKKFYSTSKHVPDNIHREVIEKLEIEVRRQYPDLKVSVEVPTQIQIGFILPA